MLSCCDGIMLFLTSLFILYMKYVRWEIVKNIYMPLWKENLCSDHNKFHRYQQNEQSPLILTVLIEHKKTMTYDVGNLCPGLGQTHRCDQVKLVNGIYWSQPFPLDNRVNSSFVFVCVRSRQSNSIVNIIHFMYSSSPVI